MDYALGRIAAEARADERAAFVRRTYLHLAGAILAFAGLETVLMTIIPEQTRIALISGSGALLITLLLFMAVAWVADYWAQTAQSVALQYAGLGLYVLAEAVIFMPLLTIAN